MALLICRHLRCLTLPVRQFVQAVIHRRNIRESRRAILCWVSVSLVALVATIAQAGHIVGIEFITAPKSNPLVSLAPIDNLFPFSITGPGSNFAANGALVGLSESDVQHAIVDAVQAMFRHAELDLPGQMLHVDIRHGPVTPEVGTVHLVGRSFAPSTLFGTAYPTGATFRPDLQPNSVYTNELSVTFADSIAEIPILDPNLQFDHLYQVVHAIAGTVAHEIGHTLNVWNHDPGGEPVGDWYPIMASGATNLPLSARLEERRFLHISGTQYQHPGPPPGGPLVYSVTETLVNASGTTYVSDFNFDGAVDGGDFQIWNSNKFREGTGVKAGDANGDGITDGSDFNIWNMQRMEYLRDSEAVAKAGHAFTTTVQVPEPSTLGLPWFLVLLGFRRFFSARRGNMRFPKKFDALLAMP